MIFISSPNTLIDVFHYFRGNLLLRPKYWDYFNGNVNNEIRYGEYIFLKISIAIYSRAIKLGRLLLSLIGAPFITN